MTVVCRARLRRLRNPVACRTHAATFRRGVADRLPGGDKRNPIAAHARRASHIRPSGSAGAERQSIRRGGVSSPFSTGGGSPRPDQPLCSKTKDRRVARGCRRSTVLPRAAARAADPSPAESHAATVHVSAAVATAMGPGGPTSASPTGPRTRRAVSYPQPAGGRRHIRSVGRGFIPIFQP